MTIKVGARPGSLDGCWQQWSEQQVDNVIKTKMEDGALHSRRRYTGTARLVKASVTLPAHLYPDFVAWFNISQRHGSIATRVKTPYGTEEVFQWIAPPTITWPESNPNLFTAAVEMYRGAGFP